jgi:hypothetical protein
MPQPGKLPGCDFRKPSFLNQAPFELGRIRCMYFQLRSAIGLRCLRNPLTGGDIACVIAVWENGESQAIAFVILFQCHPTPIFFAGEKRFPFSHFRILGLKQHGTDAKCSAESIDGHLLRHINSRTIARLRMQV